MCEVVALGKGVNQKGLKRKTVSWVSEATGRCRIIRVLFWEAIES